MCARLLCSPSLQFAMEPNYLHIWPRNTFMMIALPNLVRAASKRPPLPSTLLAFLSLYPEAKSSRRRH